MPAYVVNKFCIADMLGDLVGLRARSNTDSPTRESYHFQMVLVQQIAQSCRPVAVVLQNVAAQLNAGKSKFRDFLDGLGVVVTPSDCRVAEANHSRCWGNRSIK